MKKIRTIIYILIATICFKQQNCTAKGCLYNININNGLPTNNVYSTIVDHNGYLWIATTNGVIRYSGYELKVFTVSEGLPTDDVWQITEDSKGRIWLGSIADKIGYIYNEQYHAAKFQDKSYHTIYPTNLRAVDNSIAFFSSYLNNNLNTSYCIEKNDTIKMYTLYPELKKIIPDYNILEHKNIIQPFINNEGECCMIFGNKLFNYVLKNDKIAIESSINIRDSQSIVKLVTSDNIMIKKYIISYFNQLLKNYFNILNTKTGVSQIININDAGVNEKILSISYNSSCIPSNIFHIKTENYILEYTVTDSVRFTNKFLLTDISTDTDIKGEKVNTFYKNNFWGNCLSTNTNGLDINYLTPNNFTLHPNIDIKNFTYCGVTKNGSSIWWNNTTQTVCKLSPNYTTSIYNISAATEIKTIDENMIHVGTKNIFYDSRSDKVYLYADKNLAIGKYYIMRNTPPLWYAICNFGFLRVDSVLKRDALILIDKDRYKDLIYDSLTGDFWAYNKNKILIYNKKPIRTYTQEQLYKFGIQTIDKICIDNTYGNIFFKGNERITMYDKYKNSYVELFTDINLKEANIAIYNNIFIICGRFGILFCYINGHGNLSRPIIYNNIKNYNYNYINDFACFQNKVILNTNKGIYSVSIPVDYQSYLTQNTFNTQYKYIYFNKNIATNINSGDTIRIDQKDLNIKFDVINPYGNGQLKYTITYHENEIKINNSEFNLPSYLQTPDNYYKIKLIAYDRVWRSKPIELIIYISPKWWQTKTMIKIIWIGSILSLFMVITGSILITKKLVTRSNQKKNMRMEMELKAIYAQINPHFIFNSLNSALLLVSKNKVDEAYTHILKFSRLLRSYIKSSRNKLISINEEVNNLKNYIELQQVRFKDKFEYEIIIDEQIEVNSINIPSLLLQPFVENAIEHGLLHKNESGRLKIEFKYERSTKKLLCIIDDDGIGRKESKLIKTPNPNKDESYGELLIKDLVNIFNKYENMNIHIDYFDKDAPLSGTIVTIKIDLT